MIVHGRLVVADTAELVADRLRVADRFWSRMMGLQMQPPLPPGEALLLIPCSSVHTCFVRFPLDLIFLDSVGKVVSVRRDVCPWRIVWTVRSTYAVLELRAEGAPRIEAGCQLRFEPAVTASTPRSLGFLCPSSPD
jgi:uncharacterized membrane protein (UPF0127 family)